MATSITREHLDQHIPNSLRNRVRIYLGLAVLILAVIIYRLFQDGGDAYYSIAVFIFGAIVGIFVARMYKISWDTDAEKVVSRLDTYGIILLVAYIIFELFGEHYIRQYFAGPMILTMILSLAGGAVLGRGLGMGRMILRTLRKNI